MTKARAVTGLFVLLLLIAPRVGAQSAEFLDDLMFAEEATFGQASVLVLMAAGITDAGEDEKLAAAAVVESDWAATERDAGAPITLGDYSYLIMTAFEIPGGLGYRLFDSPRYAARELDYLGLVRGYASPKRVLSGPDLLQILGNVVNWLEERS
jgi:hypothetical protein